MLLFKVTKQLCNRLLLRRSWIHSHILASITFTASEMTERRHAEKQIIHFLHTASDFGSNVGCSGTFKDLSFHSARCPTVRNHILSSLLLSLHMHLGSELCEGDMSLICNCISKHLQLTCYVLLVPYISCPSSSPEGKLQEGGTFVSHLYLVC